jgi:hypothetical protein
MASKIEAIRRKFNFDSHRETKAMILESLELLRSKTEVRKVAVTNRDARTRHQEAIDRRHQAAEQSGRGQEADGSSLGHGGSLLRRRGTTALH